VKAMVAYDSTYGNTEQVAKAVGAALGPEENVEILRVGEVTPERLASLSLLVVGCPTQKFSPTGTTTRMLKGIPTGGLRGVKVAAFDTRITEAEVERIKVLALFVRLFGYAAEPVADRLRKKGGDLVAPPEPFYVTGTEGPLLDGELERAGEWAAKILAAVA